MAVLSVADSGIGIAAPDLPHVFDPFSARIRRVRARTAARSGTVDCQYIAIAHGGSIDASSEGPNKGATFTVRLPLANAPAAPSSQAQAPRTQPPAAR